MGNQRESRAEQKKNQSLVFFVSITIDSLSETWPGEDRSRTRPNGVCVRLFRFYRDAHRTHEHCSGERDLPGLTKSATICSGDFNSVGIFPEVLGRTEENKHFLHIQSIGKILPAPVASDATVQGVTLTSETTSWCSPREEVSGVLVLPLAEAVSASKSVHFESLKTE